MVSLITTYNHVFFELADRRSDDWLLMGSPWMPVSISVLYAYLVTKAGPRFMKDRPAYNVDSFIGLYNVVQIFLCFDIFIRAFTLGWGTKYRVFCEPVDYSDDEEAVYIARGMWKYYIIKIVDLLDTVRRQLIGLYYRIEVFFLLRKKNSQVTFLHVYHHAGMVVIAWIFARFVPGGHGILVGATNCFVHVVMYAYYFVSNTWPEYKKNLWWKKHITQLQLTQFVILALHTLPTLLLKDCQYPASLGVLILFQNVFMFVLFYNFYRKAYGTKKKTK